MTPKDLADVCGYMKKSIIPCMPEDFAVAEKFRYGFTQSEISAGISAFGLFLAKLYDNLAADRERLDVSERKKSDKYFSTAKIEMLEIEKDFPALQQFAVILFSLGIHGKIEVKHGIGLAVEMNRLLTPLASEKFITFSKMENGRRIELFKYLSEMGFNFEGIDFTGVVDFEKTGVVHLTYRHDGFMPLGLKLIAEAQANIKSPFYKYSTAFLRCDFYPLESSEPSVQKVNFNEYVNAQPPKMREQLISLNKLLINECRVSGEISNGTTEGKFSYVSRKNKRAVCTIRMDIFGCSIKLNGYHFDNPNNIVAELPDSMIETMKKCIRHCEGCSGGKKRFHYTHKGKNYSNCLHGGFEFEIDDALDIELIKKWIKLELAFN